MNINESLQVFLNYNFESSAKKTGKVLAVIETKCGKKAVKQLKCLDLNELGLLTKIKLW